VASTRTFLLATLVLAASLALVGALAAGAGEPTDDGNGSPLGDGVYETAGNWTVEAGQAPSFTDLTIIVNGNLTVGFGGSLSLRDVVLVINTAGGVPRHVVVEPTATMVMIDTDGNPATTGDACVLKASSLSHRYSLEVQSGGTLQALRSFLSDLGGADGVGLHVLSSDVRLEDTTVEAFDSVLVESAAPQFLRVAFVGTIDSSMFFFASGANLDHCTVSDCYYGVSVRGTPVPVITNLTATNCFVPLDLEAVEVTVRGGTLWSAQYGAPVRLNASARATLIDVTFDEDRVELLDDASALEVRWTLELRVVDQDLRPVEGASVTVNDTRGQVAFTGPTDAQGIARVELLDHIRTKPAVDPRNPYTVLVRKDRYHAQVTIAVTSYTSREVVLTTNLNPIIEVVSPRSGTRVVMGQGLRLDATGSRDPNGDTLNFKWTTNLGDRVLYDGHDPVAGTTMLLGETSITLTVTDGLGGVSSTAITVTVLQATQVTKTLPEPQYTATLVATYGGTGEVVLDVATYPPPYPGDLIGVFVTVHASGDVVFASGSLEVRYDVALLPFGMNESSITIAREDAGIWYTVAGTSVDLAGHTVSADIPSFGMYAVRGVIPPNIPPRLLQTEVGRLVPPHDVQVRAGTAFELVYAAEDELPAFCMLDVSGLPAGVHSDRTTKRVWGVAPATAGPWRLELTLTDVGGLTARAVIYLNATGELPAPQLWSETITPSKGDYLTIFEAKVLYRSELSLAPAFVALEAGKQRFEMVPDDPLDRDYVGGVMYHTYFMLNQSSKAYKLQFNASDGTRSNLTTTAVELRVGAPSYAPTGMETAIILVTLLAIIVIIGIIRMTSTRYQELKDAHLGRDSEGEIGYIRPAPREPGSPPPAGGAKGGGGPAAKPGTTPEGKPEAKPEAEPEAKAETKPETKHAPVPGPKAGEPPAGGKGAARAPSPAKDIEEVDGQMEHLDEELKELDEEIDKEEQAISKIDSDIEGIIDELDGDNKKA